MKKEDLKVNDIAKFRDGTMCMVHTFMDKKIFVAVAGWNPFSCYTGSLLEKKGRYTDLDIVEVRRPVKEYQLCHCSWKDAPIIWERKEPKKMTLSEISEILGYEVEIVDED